MDTREEIAKNLDNPDWMKAVCSVHAAHLFGPIEERYHYWESDRESEPVENDTEYFKERGIVLSHFDETLETKEYRRWKEIVLLESGQLSLMTSDEVRGYVRSDFEAYAGFHDRNRSALTLSGQLFEETGAGSWIRFSS